LTNIIFEKFIFTKQRFYSFTSVENLALSAKKSFIFRLFKNHFNRTPPLYRVSQKHLKQLLTDASPMPRSILLNYNSFKIANETLGLGIVKIGSVL